MAILDLVKKVMSSGSTKDPVCGMAVDLTHTQYKSTRDGKEYGFCSQSCKDTFDKQPQKSTKSCCCD